MTKKTDLHRMLEAVKAYAEQKGILPSTVLQYAISAGSNRFRKLESGEADMTSKLIQRVHDWMAANK